MKRFFARHILLRRFLAMVVIVVLFMVGRSIPVPLVPLDGVFDVSRELKVMAGATGGNLSQVSLFSLGLGPYMYAMLLSQLFSGGRRGRALSPRVVAFRKNTLLLIIATIQGLALALTVVKPETKGDLLGIAGVTFTLVTGAVVISWLGDMNTAFGIGGAMVIMMANLLLAQFENLPLIARLWAEGQHAVVGGVVGWIVLIIGVMVVFDRSEYRIPIQRISIHNDYIKDSYMPIKVNIVGGMPLMYAYTFLVFPQYLLMLALYFKPEWVSLQGLSRYFTTTNMYGIILYLVIIVVLTFSLALVQIDAYAKAEEMRQSGDYIPGVRPGRPTKSYITRYVVFFAWFNAVYLAFLSGVPLLVSLGNKDWQTLAGMTGVFLMFTGMSLTILEELRVFRLRKQYQSIFD